MNRLSLSRWLLPVLLGVWGHAAPAGTPAGPSWPGAGWLRGLAGVRLGGPALWSLVQMQWARVTFPKVPPGESATPAYAEALAKVRKVELANPDGVPEAEEVLASAVTHDADLLQDARKAVLVKTWDAARPPMKHNGGRVQRAPGAHAGYALEGQAGPILMYGPYEDIEAGRYLVVYRVRALKPVPEGNVCFLDVSHDAVTFNGLRPDGKVVRPGRWSHVAVPINVPEKMGFEFRLWPDGHPITVDRIYLFRLEAGPER